MLNVRSCHDPDFRHMLNGKVLLTVIILSQKQTKSVFIEADKPNRKENKETKKEEISEFSFF